MPFESDILIESRDSYSNERDNFYSKLKRETDEFNSAVDSICSTENARLARENSELEATAIRKYKIFKTLKIIALLSPVVFALFATIHIVINFDIYEYKIEDDNLIGFSCWVLLAFGIISIAISTFLLISLFKREIYYNRGYIKGATKYTVISISVTIVVIAIAIVYVILFPSQIYRKGDFVFTKEYDNYYLVRYEGEEESVVLPKDCFGEKYFLKSYLFFNCQFLTSITIPDGMTSISYCAFWNCSKLTSTTIIGTMAQMVKLSFGDA